MAKEGCEMEEARRWMMLGQALMEEKKIKGNI